MEGCSQNIAAANARRSPWRVSDRRTMALQLSMLGPKNLDQVMSHLALSDLLSLAGESGAMRDIVLENDAWEYVDLTLRTPDVLGCYANTSALLAAIATFAGPRIGVLCLGKDVNIDVLVSALACTSSLEWLNVDELTHLDAVRVLSVPAFNGKLFAGVNARISSQGTLGGALPSTLLPLLERNAPFDRLYVTALSLNLFDCGEDDSVSLMTTLGSAALQHDALERLDVCEALLEPTFTSALADAVVALPAIRILDASDLLHVNQDASAHVVRLVQVPGLERLVVECPILCERRVFGAAYSAQALALSNALAANTALAECKLHNLGICRDEGEMEAMLRSAIAAAGRDVTLDLFDGPPFFW